MIVNILLFICVAMTMEVVFTAVADGIKKRDLSLTGKTYLWMAPIYAVVYPAFVLLWPTIGGWPWFARGGLYVVLVYSVEFASGWILRRSLGACPWDYGRARWAVDGLIRLDYAPAWFGATMLYESLFKHLSHA
ncbi:MAG: hypothetical protein V3S11_03465 [Elusimicrobiota bacterium]